MLNSEAIVDHRRQSSPIRLDGAELIISRELSADARTPTTSWQRTPTWLPLPASTGSEHYATPGSFEASMLTLT